MNRRTALAVAALSLAALACTCGGLLGGPRAFLPDEVQERADELEAMATDFDFEEFSEGLDELEESLDLSASFPQDFPLPEGMAVESSFEFDGSINAVLSYSGTLEDAVVGFETVLTEAGYTIDSKEEIITPMGGSIILEFSGAEWSGEVTIAGADGAMGIQISLSPTS
jgi:hypothetical protein